MPLSKLAEFAKASSSLKNKEQTNSKVCKKSQWKLKHNNLINNPLLEDFSIFIHLDH